MTTDYASTAGDQAAKGALAFYDSDEAFRVRCAEMYRTSRSGFIAALIRLAYEHGAGRPEAVAFANAVTRRVRSETTGETT